eukprot:6183838-Pleurochrysis_carterae.AAC.2
MTSTSFVRIAFRHAVYANAKSKWLSATTTLHLPQSVIRLMSVHCEAQETSHQGKPPSGPRYSIQQKDHET